MQSGTDNFATVPVPFATQQFENPLIHNSSVTSFYHSSGTSLNKILGTYLIFPTVQVLNHSPPVHSGTYFSAINEVKPLRNSLGTVYKFPNSSGTHSTPVQVPYLSSEVLYCETTLGTLFHRNSGGSLHRQQLRYSTSRKQVRYITLHNHSGSPPIFGGGNPTVAGCPSYNIFILMGECWFFLNDQHSPIIKKINPQNLSIFK
jgi:hypothetical protein